jgi:hypothetical protein
MPMQPFKPHNSGSTILRLTQDPGRPPAATRRSSEPPDELASPIKLWCFTEQDSFESYKGTSVHIHGYSLIHHGRALSRVEWPKLHPLHVFMFHVSDMAEHQQAANSAAFSAGKVILLERDPTNSHDPNEIRVMTQDGKQQAGFVAKDIAAMMAPIMDAANTSRVAGAVLKTFADEHHRVAIEVVAAAGRELRLVL